MNFGEDLFFFLRSPNFGQKKTFDVWFSAERPTFGEDFLFFFFFFFFGGHLILGGKNISISGQDCVFLLFIIKLFCHSLP